MRRLAFLVLVWVGISACGAVAGAQDRLPAASVPDSSVRALPAISVAARYQSADEAASLSDVEWATDSALSPEVLVLAIWLPIAGILLGLLMEGATEIRPQETRSSLWVK